MRKEFVITLIIGIIYVIVLSLPRWNNLLLFNRQSGQFKILQPIIHILLAAGLLAKKDWCRKIMIFLSAMTILFSIPLIPGNLNIVFILYLTAVAGVLVYLLQFRIIINFINKNDASRTTSRV